MQTSPRRVLSLIPPMTQLNTPYPSTAYLTGFLRSRGVDAVQDDLALKLVLELFTPASLAALRDKLRALPGKKRPPALASFDAQFQRYTATIGPAIAFLQGRDPTIAHRIASRAFLPEGPRFASLDVYIDPDGGDPLAWAFGALGVQDKARHLATLYLNDLADVLREAADSRFEFVRYAESLAMAQPTFTPLAAALAAPPTLVDETLHRLTLDTLAHHQPQVVLLSVPFPGSVYAAFRIAQTIKAHHPEIVTVLGGGFVNTELRELTEPRVFDYFDYLTLDDGERRCWRSSSTSTASAAARGWCAPTCVKKAKFATSTSSNPTCPSPKSARPPGTACRWIATCPSSTCSTPCTGCGPTGAGTSSPWPTAATGKSAPSATSASTTSAATTASAPGCWSIASKPWLAKPARPAFTSSMKPRRPRPSRPWPTNWRAATARFRGGATSASKNRSRRNSANSLPTDRKSTRLNSSH